MTRTGASWLLAAWLLLLVGLAWFVQSNLRIAADLRLFLPEATTAEQRLLLDEIGEGPTSRLLIVALSGGKPDALAEASQALAGALRASERFRFVTNGAAALEEIPDALLNYRYLLTNSFDEGPLTSDTLSSELAERELDLASPAASFIEPILARDPTLETLKIVEHLQPAREPRREFDVWFTQDLQSALMLVETQAAGFDPQGQAAAMGQIQSAFQAIRADQNLTLEVSGPGAFSVLMQSRTSGEAQTFGAIASVGMMLLLLLAYRRFGAVILSALPLATAAIAGMVAVSALFGTVHGITLAFGFTLIGVAQDYPVHLLSHQHAGESPVHTARQIWPTLATGVASTCVAYLAFLISGVPGLAQLATFTVTGLLVAGLTTRFVLPRLSFAHNYDVANFRWVQRLHDLSERVHIPRWIGGAALLVAVLVLWFAPGPFWQNDLSTLTPVPTDLLARDQALRRELGTSDVRYSIAVTANSQETALQRLESLESKLEALSADGAIAGFDHAAHYLPSVERQRQRQLQLPDESTLAAMVRAAVANTSFQPDAFDDFMSDVRTARSLEPLTMAALAGTPLQTQLESLLLAREARVVGLVTLAGVKDVSALHRLVETTGSDVFLLDLKAATESLVAQQRTYILWSLAIAAVLLTLVVVIALRQTRRVLRVLTPMMLTTVVIITVLNASGVQLSLFHLISLVLAAGLGLDYALFFERSSGDVQEQHRTLHAVIVCSLSTLLVFALLSLSTLPVLQAIGVTVALGVVSNFVLALVISRSTSAQHG